MNYEKQKITTHTMESFDYYGELLCLDMLDSQKNNRSNVENLSNAQCVESKPPLKEKTKGLLDLTSSYF